MMGREELHALVDKIDSSGISIVYQLLLRFVPEYEEVLPLPDEVEGIRIAQEEIAKGEVFTHDEVFNSKISA